MIFIRYTFSDVLNMLMKERNLTNSDLCRELELRMKNPPSRTAIGNWRKGATVQRKETITALCEYFNVDKEFLLAESLVRNKELQRLKFEQWDKESPNISEEINNYEKAIEFFKTLGYELTVDATPISFSKDHTLVDHELIEIEYAEDFEVDYLLVDKNGNSFLCNNYEDVMCNIKSYAQNLIEKPTIQDNEN